MILKLTLKKKWFDMIASGEKQEEYREIKDYWARRLVQNYFEMESAMWLEMVHDLKNPTKRHTNLHELLDYFNCSFKKIDTIRFTNGYRKESPFIEVECLGIDVVRGKEEWGAEKGKNYFVIKLGEIRRIKWKQKMNYLANFTSKKSTVCLGKYINANMKNSRKQNITNVH